MMTGLMSFTEYRPKHCWLSPFWLVAVLTIPVMTTSVISGESILRNAEFRPRIFCGNFDAECPANCTLSEFRIPQNFTYGAYPISTYIVLIIKRKQH